MDRIQFRRDTLANWNSVNPILLEGEIGYVLDNPNLHKMGDGVHTWDQLPFRGFDGTIVHDTGYSENAVMSQKAVSEKLTEIVSNIAGGSFLKSYDEKISGLILDDGTIISNEFYYYKYNVSENDKFIITYHIEISSDYVSWISLWNGDTFVKNIGSGLLSEGESRLFSIIIPNGVDNIRLNIQTDGVYINKAVNETNIDALIDFSQKNINLCNKLLKNTTSFVSQAPVETQSCLIDENGNIVQSSYITSFYNVSEGDTLEINCIDPFETSRYSQVSAWNGNTFVRNLLPTPTEGNTTINYLVPQGVNKIAVSVGHNFKIKDFNFEDKKSIKCLFIGNSVCQDHVAYLPWLLKNTYPDLNFEIYLAYKGGWTIKGYVQEIITGDKNIDIFSIAKNTESWTNLYGVSFDSMFRYAEYDIIVYEGYFNNNPKYPIGDVLYPSEDSSYFKLLIDYIKTKQSSPFKVGYLLHQTYDNPSGGGGEGYTETEVWGKIMQGMKDAILTTPVDIIFPCGVVSKILESDFGKSFLTEDNVHNNQGLPCIMGAYTLMKKISSYLGLKDMIINNPLRIDIDKEAELNIPGSNGSLKIGTEEQYNKAQSAAIDSIKYIDAVFNSNCLDLLL